MLQAISIHLPHGLTFQKGSFSWKTSSCETSSCETSSCETGLICTLKIGIWIALLYQFYRVFHGFGQAKFAFGGLVWWLEPVYTTAPAVTKNNAWFKSGQNWLKNIHIGSLI
jgi:hypothetical protein